MNMKYELGSVKDSGMCQKLKRFSMTKPTPLPKRHPQLASESQATRECLGTPKLDSASNRGTLASDGPDCWQSQPTKGLSCWWLQSSDGLQPTGMLSLLSSILTELKQIITNFPKIQPHYRRGNLLVRQHGDTLHQRPVFFRRQH